ncbi:MAG: OmpH family outer membrane protein [Flavobacteriaceae bacterium]|nr:OmpH family outer membrane protein [Flavobacteriaceae bacterium]
MIFNTIMISNKKLSILFVFCLINLTLQAQRGLRIGYVDMEYIMENVPEFQQSMNMVDMKAQKWSSDLAKKKAEIEKLKEELDNERPLLTPELIEEKEEEIEYLTEKMFEFQDEKFGVGGELMTQKRQIIIPIQDQVFNAVQEIGENRGYDFIFENSAEALLLFSARRHDLSEIVLKLIKRNAKQDQLQGKDEEDEMFGGEYKSVKDAEADEQKKKEAEEKIAQREREREQQLDERARVRDSIKAEREAKFQKRREEIEKKRVEQQRKRDSIRELRENN